MHRCRISIRKHRIRWLDEPSLTYFKGLQELDLSGNGLGWLGNDVFNIDKLEILKLHDNNLKYITNIAKDSKELRDNANWFGGLKKLKSLDISKNFLEYFPSNVFEPLETLQNFSMNGNRFKGLPNNFFVHLTTIQFLDISRMPALRIENWDEHLQYLKSLNHLIASRFTDCCFVQAANPGSQCEAPKDAIASCERMIKYPALRYLMWFLVVLTIGGNMFALLMRLVKDDSNKVQNILICSLSFSDMLMGIYLVGIINQEIATRGEYYRHDISWRTGTSCKVFGVISVISSEVSVFTLVFIAYDRFLHIVHALEFRKIGYRTAVFLLVVTWLGCSAIAIIPAVVDSYFYNEELREGFYGTNSICLPLQLPGENTTAWEYCLAVFGALNFVGAVYLIVAYCQMFYSSYTSAKNSKNNARLGVHTTMAKRFAAVVFTDVCCWVPIAMLLLLSLTKAVTDTSQELYMWFSICVIPINSAINPILYTLSTPLFWEKVKDTIKKMLFCVSKGGATTLEDKPELIKKVNREKNA